MEPKDKTNGGKYPGHDPLQRKWLRLGEIIDLARGATDWPLPDPWKGRFKDLKAAVEHKELKCGHGVIIVNKSTFISLDNFWAFAVEQDALWDWLRDFCQRWRAARGIVLEEQFHGQESGLLDSEQGSFPGRPSKMRAIEQEMRRRAEEGKLEPTLAAESRALYAWVDGEFLKEQIPTALTIQNALRKVFHDLRDKIPIK